MKCYPKYLNAAMKAADVALKNSLKAGADAVRSAHRVGRALEREREAWRRYRAERNGVEEDEGVDELERAVM